MILVTSAAGHTGRYFVAALVKAGFEVAATDVNPVVRDLPGIKEAFVGDLTDIDFIDKLTASSDQIVYIPLLFNSEEALIGKQLIDSAIAHHAKQFIFISVTHPILTSLWQHIAKRDVEEHLIYQGMSHHLLYTILQPMHYMHNFDPKVIHQTGKYRIFYDIDAEVAYVDPVDVGEVIAKVAKNPQTYDKATFELVGTEPYSPRDLVDTYNEITGEHAVTEYVSVTEFLDEINAKDLYFRQGFKHLADSYSAWGLDGNPYVLTKLLGRKPTTIDSYIRRVLKLR